MQSLEIVVQQAASGAPDAFETIVERFQDMAVGYAFAILGDFHLAEDAAQEAFLHAHQTLWQLREAKAFPGWFRKIIFKTCDRIVRRKRLKTVSIEAALNVASSEPDPPDVVDMSEMKDVVWRAIEALPEHQRQVIALYYIADYSQSEIGCFLDLPVTTVKKRLYDARKQLKERLMVMVQDYLQDNRPSKDDLFMGKVMDIIAPKPTKHGDGIYSLFELENRPDTFQWRQGRMAHSHLDWETSRVVCLDGDVVAALGVYDIAMRIGTARVRTAGFNLHTTHQDYQAQQLTLITKMAQSSLEAMRDQGYDLSITFDDEPFWYRLGYVFGWRALQWSVKISDLPAGPVEFERFEFKPEHREDLADLFNQDHNGLTGTAVRPTYLHNKHPGLFKGWFWTDGKGNPLGYISGDDNSVLSLDLKRQHALDQGQITKALRQRFETGTAWFRQPLSEQAHCLVQQKGTRWLIVDGRHEYLIVKGADTLNVRLHGRNAFWVDESAGDPRQRLQALGYLARQAGCDSIFFDRLHYKSVLAKHLRTLVSCRIETGDARGGHRAYVARIINLNSLFEKLAPELSNRLSQSPLAHWSGQLLISTGEETITLALDQAKVSVTPATASDHQIRGGAEIAQLILGTETPDEIIEMNKMQLTGDAAQLMPVLFPAQYPQMGNQGL